MKAEPKMRKPCRHCNRHPVTRPRGLCWTCWQSTDIRRRYQSTSKFSHRGVGIGYIQGLPPPVADGLSARAGQGPRVGAAGHGFDESLASPRRNVRSCDGGSGVVS